MERPGHADYRVKNSAVRLHVIEKAEHAIDPDGEDAVERKKIGRERDPKIGSIGDDMAAVPSDPETANPTAHEPHPNRVSQFVTKDVKKNRPRQTHECNQPKHRA